MIRQSHLAPSTRLDTRIPSDAHFLRGDGTVCGDGTVSRGNAFFCVLVKFVFESCFLEDGVDWITHSSLISHLPTPPHYHRSWKVLLAIAIHRQAISTRPRLDNWSRVWCSHGESPGQAGQVANLGHGWSRILSIHYSILLSRRRRRLACLWHYTEGYFSASWAMVGRSETA